MALDDVQIKLEELDLDSEQIVEVLSMLDKMSDDDMSDEKIPIEESVAFIKREMITQKEWRKRAKSAAKIISLKLD